MSKPHFKISISNTDKSVCIYTKKQPQSLSEIIKHIHALLLAWGFNTKELKNYFESREKLNEEFERLQKKNDTVFRIIDKQDSPKHG